MLHCEIATKLNEDVKSKLCQQVKHAVQVFVNALGKADTAHNRLLLQHIKPDELYEAGLAVMLRLACILCAEAKGLLPLGEAIYDKHHAISTLREQLENQANIYGYEILKNNCTAWPRILAVFKRIYQGMDDSLLNLSTLNTAFFNRKFFPFLQGEVTLHSNNCVQSGLIDDHTVLILLKSLQILHGKNENIVLSYKNFTEGFIGNIYEELLDYTVQRCENDILELKGASRSDNIYINLTELEKSHQDNFTKLSTMLASLTRRSKTYVDNALNKDVDEATFHTIFTNCHGNLQLAQRIKPFAHVVKQDIWGNFGIHPAQSLVVVSSSQRRNSGTHYTPHALTENIVKTTLEPLVYEGFMGNKPQNKQYLKPSGKLLSLKICDPAMGSGAFLLEVCQWLAKKIVEAWQEEESQGYFINIHGNTQKSKQTELSLPCAKDERLLIARRLIAQKCLYGVDKNPLAVELAQLSLWLITASTKKPFLCLNHNLCIGDSLLGITHLKQLQTFSLFSHNKYKILNCTAGIQIAMDEAVQLRTAIQNSTIECEEDRKKIQNLLIQSKHKLKHLKYLADIIIVETLTAQGKEKIYDNALKNMLPQLQAYLKDNGKTPLHFPISTEKTPCKPFHWILEFPEVFKCGGFDAIITNPPFMGGQKLSGVLGKNYRNYLVTHIAHEKKSSADLVAYFILRAHDLLTKQATCGIIAVNTISEGKTREVGLECILNLGSTIYHATPNILWPGKAKVVTSTVHICKGKWSAAKYINHKQVEFISSALNERKYTMPHKLPENQNMVFQGVISLSAGFIVDKQTLMQWKKQNDPSCAVVFDYLIGEEVNKNPNHSPQRKIINFWDWPKDKAASYAQAFKYIKNIQTERSFKTDKGAKEFWWRYLRPRPELFHAIGREQYFDKHPKNWLSTQKNLENVIVFVTGATKYPCFTLVPNTAIFANSLCVMASQSFALLACLSSDLHTVWAWEFGSRLKQDLRYTHGDIFETFPFPQDIFKHDNILLSKIGKQFFHLRAQYMLGNDKGMTKFYNDFHNPNIMSPPIQELREVQIKLNETLLTAYGFKPIKLEHGFHNVAYLPKNKNLRFTISESARAKVLSALIALNKSRIQI